MTGARQAAVVAWYGHETEAMTALRTHVQGMLAEALGATFVPRAPGTLHSTVVGLDAFAPFPDGPAGDAVRQRTASADLAGLVGELVAAFGSASVVQFGGFGDRDHPVTSRGHRLGDRTLVVHGRTVVLVGWPVVDGVPTWELDGLRRRLALRGFSHRYPLDDGASDPDAHMVVGELAADPSPGTVGAVRRALADRAFTLALPVEQLVVVTYTDPRLPPASTARAPVTTLRV